MTLDRMRQDGIELTEYLCEHLGRRKVILVAHSFGTILGLRMIREIPDLFFAYVGTGQVADETRIRRSHHTDGACPEISRSDSDTAKRICADLWRPLCSVYELGSVSQGTCRACSAACGRPLNLVVD